MNISDQLNRFLDVIVRELGTSYHSDNNISSDLVVNLVDLSPLRLRLSSETPFINVTAEDIINFGEKKLVELVKQEVNTRTIMPGSVVVLVESDIGLLSELKNDPYWAIIINTNSINAIINHNNPKRYLQDFLRSQVPLRFLSPYDPNQPVTGSQFYGRESECNLILTHDKSSFAVYGGRMIGKTSLLKEVRRRLITKILPIEQTKRVFWFDFWGYQGEEIFFEDVVRHFGEGFPKLVRPDFASYFPRFIERMKSVHGGPIIFFLDEVDDLIQYERHTNYHLLGLLKRIAQAGDCRLIMAGFRLLNEELNRHDTPLNFLRRLHMGNLKRDQTISMFRDPMNSLNISIENGVIPQILSDTGGHPQLLQLFGQTFIELLDLSGERCITMNHVRKVKEGGRLHDVLVETLIDNTSDLGFALVCSLANQEEFGLENIDNILISHQINIEIKQIRQICSSLEVTGIISRKGQSDQYHFTIPLQPILALKIANEDFLWRKALQQVKTEGTILW